MSVAEFEALRGCWDIGPERRKCQVRARNQHHITVSSKETTRIVALLKGTPPAAPQADQRVAELQRYCEEMGETLKKRDAELGRLNDENEKLNEENRALNEENQSLAEQVLKSTQPEAQEAETAPAADAWGDEPQEPVHPDEANELPDSRPE